MTQPATNRRKTCELCQRTAPVTYFPPAPFCLCRWCLDALREASANPNNPGLPQFVLGVITGAVLAGKRGTDALATVSPALKRIAAITGLTGDPTHD